MWRYSAAISYLGPLRSGRWKGTGTFPEERKGGGSPDGQDNMPIWMGKGDFPSGSWLAGGGTSAARRKKSAQQANGPIPCYTYYH
ncbi:hypothetical protein DESUT3_40960 [Desulfuromonas versatilis]|uniref:Uncharacterized protein n=1 Tax=Desulfuromonas versatilis TaxID=2802975 RepID=A0ABN6E4A9_9BACT|nr:hypothetical protein DESUT3_40960 [Desulfuromonas versatilis]